MYPDHCRPLLYLFALLFFAGAIADRARAQAAAFEHVSYRGIASAEGLPSETVYGVVEDAEGWMWVGTPAGLFRYDGVAFVPYRSRVARHSDIHDLQFGPGGRLFAQNFRGQLFCVSGDSLRLVGDFQGAHAQFVSYAFRGDTLLVAASDGVRGYALDAAAWPLGEASPYTLVARVRNAELHSLGPVGAVAAFNEAASTGRLNALGRALPPLPPDASVLDSSPQGDSAWVTRWLDNLDDGTRRIELLSVHRGGRVLSGGEYLLPKGLKGRGKIFAQRTPAGDFLFGGMGGLVLVGAAGPQGTTPTNLLPGKTVNCMQVDSRGNLWVGTQSQGLLLIPDLGVRQHDYPAVEAPLVDLAASADDGALFGVRNNGAVYALGERARALSAFGYVPRFIEGAGGGLFVGPAQVYPNPPRNLSRALEVNVPSVKEGVLLPDGALVLATSAGALTLPPHGAPDRRRRDQYALGTFAIQERRREAAWRPDSVPYFELRGRRATGVAFDAARAHLYVAYNDSLLRYPLGARTPEEVPASVTGGRAEAVHVADDRLFVALTDRGLSVVDLRSGGAVDHYLPELTVERVRTAGDYHWAHTNDGPYRALREGAALDFERVDTRMGLPTGKPSAFFATARYAYAAYDRRVVRIPAGAPARRAVAQQVSAARTRVAGQTVTVPAGEPLPVVAAQQTVSFQTRLPDYSQAPSASFEYRIAARDSSWQIARGPGADISFASLPEGSHTLEVRLRGEPQTTARFRIDARIPFWRKPWPYVLATLLAAGLAIVWVRRRAAVRQAAAEQEAALRDSQLSALTAQMNPHFIFNALNSVQDFMLSNDRVAANDYLSKFAKLIRLTLEHSRTSEITLAEELTMMRTYLELERIRFDDEIGVTLEVGEGLRLSAKLPPLLVQPYVENAFKHGLLHRRAGERSLRVRYHMLDAERLRVEVEDTGVGRARSAALQRASARGGMGFSTGATARRFELLNREEPDRFEVHTEDLYTDGEPAGTRVTLFIRLRAASAKTSLDAPVS